MIDLLKRIWKKLREHYFIELLLIWITATIAVLAWQTLDQMRTARCVTWIILVGNSGGCS